MEQAAAQRQMEFVLGRFADPLYLGDYPASVRAAVPDLPEFSPVQLAALAAAKPDYFALNHYTTDYITAVPPSRINQAGKEYP